MTGRTPTPPADEDDDAVVTNAEDQRQIKRARRAAARAERLARADLEAVLATAEGRRVLWRILAHCNVFDTAVDIRVWNPTQITFATGRQDVGHFVLAQIMDARPDALLLMIQEHATTNTSKRRG